MTFGVIIIFTDGCRALLRNQEFFRYTDTNNLIAFGHWGATRRRKLAAQLTLQEAQSWVDDLHRKPAHMKYRGVHDAEVVAIKKVNMVRSQYWKPLCAPHNPQPRQRKK